jgi:hypothetical protein
VGRLVAAAEHKRMEGWARDRDIWRRTIEEARARCGLSAIGEKEAITLIFMSCFVSLFNKNAI